MSCGDSVPSRPAMSVFSRVAILLNRIKDSFSTPLDSDGSINMSVDSCQCILVVMKHTVTSSLEVNKTTAGLNFSPDKSVKGNVIKTISPFSIVLHF